MDQRTTPRLGALRSPGHTADRFTFEAVTTRRRPDLVAVLGVVPESARQGTERRLLRFAAVDPRRTNRSTAS